MVSVIANFFVFVLKSFFSMLLWFVKCFFKALRMFFCLFPITAMVFNLLMILNVFILVGGLPDVSAIPGFQTHLVKDTAILVNLISEVKNFWNTSIYVYHESFSYVFLVLLTIILVIPIAMVLLCCSVLMGFGRLLFFAFVVDAAFYVLFAVFGRSFAAQFLGRYNKLFPKAGQKYYEKKYNKWIKSHHKEFEDYAKRPNKSRLDDFFEKEYFDDYDDDIYEEDFDDDYGDNYYA